MRDEAATRAIITLGQESGAVPLEDRLDYALKQLRDSEAIRLCYELRNAARKAKAKEIMQVTTAFLAPVIDAEYSDWAEARGLELHEMTEPR
jgi:hypothetical protein